jgi:poly [ADP-ribose] polymerase
MAEREWGRCGFEGVRGVQVVAWIDDKTSPHSFIRDWTSVVHPRPVTKLTRPVVSEYLRDPKYPLKGMTFACAGRLFKRSKHEFKTLVITHGGNFSDDVNADVDYVVSTYSELLRNRPKIARAKELDIAVVTELLVDRLIEEFGFDQSEYLLQGRLPPIAHAKVVLSPTTQTQIHTQSQTSQNTTQSHQLSARKGHIYPEAGCPNGKIYVGRDDDDKGVAYDLLLTQVTSPNTQTQKHTLSLCLLLFVTNCRLLFFFQADIVSGVNKYYHLQLIDVDGKEKRYCVFAKYGRVGTDVGATYKSEPSGLTTAKIIFAEKYLDKTGNKWEERDKFVKKPGKYFPLEVVGPSQVLGDSPLHISLSLHFLIALHDFFADDTHSLNRKMKMKNLWEDHKKL